MPIAVIPARCLSHATLERARRHTGPMLAVLLLAALIGAVLIGAGMLLTGAAYAQSAEENPAEPSSLSTEQVQHQLDALTADELLAPEVKRQLVAMYREAVQNLLLRDEAQAKAAKSRKLLTTGPASIAGINARLASGSPAAVLEDPDLLQAFESDILPTAQAMSLIESRITSLMQQSGELNRTLLEAQDAPAKASTQLAEAQFQLRELATPGLPEAAASPDPRIGVAAGVLQQSERELVVARIDMLEQRQLTQDIRQQLLQSRTALTERQIALLEQRAELLRDQLGESRKQLGEAVQDEITRLEKLVSDTSALKLLANGNVALVSDLEKSSQQQQKLAQQTIRLNSLQRQVDSSLDNVQQILAVRASGAEVGQLLSNEHLQMPDLEGLQQQLTKVQNQGIGVRLRRLQLQAQQRRSGEFESALQQLGSDLPAASKPEFEALANDVVQRRRSLLEAALAAYRPHLASIETLEVAYTRLIEQAAQLINLLEARLFWVRSAPPIGLDWWRELGSGAGWLLSPQSWSKVVRALGRGLQAHALESVLVLLLLLFVLANRSRMRNASRVHATFVGQYNDGFNHTVLSLVFTLLRVLPWPLAVLWLGYLLKTQATAAMGFVPAVGSALIASAAIYYIFSVSRLMCRSDGMMRRHFGWNEHAQKVLYRTLSWLTWVMVGATFVVASTGASSDDALAHGLGRLFFMLASLALSWAAYRILHPRRGALGDLVSRRSRLWQMRWTWFPWLVGTPLMLAVLAAVGFYFTAAEIQNRLFSTGWLMFTAFIIYGLALRWLLVANRKLAYHQAVEQQAMAAAEEEARAASELSGDARPAQLNVPTVDLSSISDQTRRLMRAFIGLATIIVMWTIWDDVIPALNFLNEFTLWARPDRADPDFVPGFVTLADLIYSLVAVAVTTVCARNLPGLVEVIFLSRLSVDAGTRYAVTTIARYVIVAAGFLVAVAFLGLDWSKMQWIVAALGVGLGFGLQEIVANFVSGLIILFERPVRVGDTVTVGGVDGTVSRLQIRATTITDWDNREILVPNRNFITDQVINWTLTNPVNRLVVPVGIAYGSDTAKAQQVMLDAVKTIPFLMTEPAPTVFFLGFGDSALDFVVRAFVPTLEDRLRGLHEIHSRIERALHDQGFVIPFPQRDVHLRPAPTAATTDQQPVENP